MEVKSDWRRSTSLKPVPNIREVRNPSLSLYTMFFVLEVSVSLLKLRKEG